MLCADFIAEFRRVMGDETRGYLWTDDEVVRYLNSAVEEACERAQLIEDRTTVDCCSLDISVGEPQYALHPSVIEVSAWPSMGGRWTTPVRRIWTASHAAGKPAQECRGPTSWST